MKFGRIVVWCWWLVWKDCRCDFGREESCQYGTFDKVPNKMHESSPYVYLHCDVLYKQGYTIIVFSLMSHIVEWHEEILKLGSYVWLENFENFPKSAKIFEKGNMFFLWVSFITRVFIIPTFESQIVPKLFHVNIIVEFWKKSLETWNLATIVVFEESTNKPVNLKL